MKIETFVNKHFHRRDLGSMVGDSRMMGLYYECRHCHKDWAFALPGSMYRGGASLQTVRILQRAEPATAGRYDDLVDHLQDAHSIKRPQFGRLVGYAFAVAVFVGLFAGLVLGLRAVVRDGEVLRVVVLLAGMAFFGWLVARQRRRARKG